MSRKNETVKISHLSAEGLSLFINIGRCAFHHRSRTVVDCLARYRCEVDAARAYNQAARALHGSSAKLNSLPEDVDVIVSSTNMSTSLQGSATKNLVSTSELMDEGGSVQYTDPPEDLTFRDLEEIPVSSGRGLWPDEVATSSVYPSVLGPDGEPEFVESSKTRGLEVNVGSTVFPEGIDSLFSADLTDGVGRDESVSTVPVESSGVAQSPVLRPIPSVVTGRGSHGTPYDADEVGFLEGEGKQGDVLTSGEGMVDTEAWTLKSSAGLTWEKESPGDDAFLEKLKLLVNVRCGMALSSHFGCATGSVGRQDWIKFVVTYHFCFLVY